MDSFWICGSDTCVCRMHGEENACSFIHGRVNNPLKRRSNCSYDNSSWRYAFYKSESKIADRFELTVPHQHLYQVKFRKENPNQKLVVFAANDALFETRP